MVGLDTFATTRGEDGEVCTEIKGPFRSGRCGLRRELFLSREEGP